MICDLDDGIVAEIKSVLMEAGYETEQPDIEQAVNNILNETVIFNWGENLEKNLDKTSKKKIKSKKQFKFPSCVSK